MENSHLGRDKENDAESVVNTEEDILDSMTWEQHSCRHDPREIVSVKGLYGIFSNKSTNCHEQKTIP